MSDTPAPEILRKLETAVASLPRAQREIFLAHRLDDLTYAQIACHTGRTVRQVKRQMAKALYKIGKQMDGRRLSWWERWF
jgi:RNA polymerase sigma-70 factor (ECF subfamily)